MTTPQVQSLVPKTPKITLLLSLALLAEACGGGAKPADADVAGTWLGSLTVGGAPLRVVFNLTADGTGTLDVPEQGLIGNPLSQVDVTGRHVVLQMQDLGARYAGDVVDSGASIAGTFTQGATALPLRLEKQPGPLDYRRPQDPVAPYPYQSEDVTFANAAAGLTLAGTLTWPPGAGPFKTVVLIGGSGPNDRNEEVYNHRPFLVLSDALTRAGIATLRYDKRGVGDSGGDYDAATSLDFAADARAAVGIPARPDPLHRVVDRARGAQRGGRAGADGRRRQRRRDLPRAAGGYRRPRRPAPHQPGPCDRRRQRRAGKHARRQRERCSASSSPAFMPRPIPPQLETMLRAVLRPRG